MHFLDDLTHRKQKQQFKKTSSNGFKCDNLLGVIWANGLTDAGK
jgi:hypothetical protein